MQKTQTTSNVENVDIIGAENVKHIIQPVKVNRGTHEQRVVG